MPLVPLTEHLRAATSLLDLARRLGLDGLEWEREMKEARANPASAPFMDPIERGFAEIEYSRWLDAGVSGDFLALLPDDLADLVERATMYNPVECLAALRGLCKGPLRALYAATEGEIVLDRGMPVPIPSRPKPFESATLDPAKAEGSLLEGCGHRLFGHSRRSIPRVVLDFRERDRLDALAWIGGKRFPRVATIHPALGDGSLHIERPTDETFAVRVVQFELDALLSWLSDQRDQAEIAVLPELCLPAPDALEAALAADPEAYPPLIVAGSAHCDPPSGVGDGKVFVNESRTYLDGRLVARHRKIQPFKTRRLGLEAFDRTLTEAIVPGDELRVLAGRRARFATVICNDLNRANVPELLVHAGVNMLLVPVLTPGEGGFNGAVCDLASRCQCVSVIVNGDAVSGGTPFHVMAGVPRPQSAEQSREYTAPAGGLPPMGIFDPNERLVEAMRWLE